MPKKPTTQTVGTRTPEETRASIMRGMQDYATRLRATRVGQGLPERISDPLTLDRLAADYAAWMAPTLDDATHQQAA